MSRKFQYIYIASLIILIGLVALIIYLVPQRGKLLEVEREQMSKLEGRWILDFDIVNRDYEDHKYTIIIKGMKEDQPRVPVEVAVSSGKRFTYTAIIFPENLTGNELTLEVYRDGRKEPVKVGHYLLQ